MVIVNCQEKYCRFINQPEWFQNYVIGISEKISIYIFMKGKKYVIIKYEGGNCWNGRHGIIYYSPRYVLIERGQTDYWHGWSKDIHEGRINKKIKEKFKNILNNYDKRKL